MCFNLLPNPNIEVIGVGWFLGTVFTFYMLFAFFTFLLDNKKRGWMVLLLSFVFCYIAIVYFGTPDFVVKPIDKAGQGTGTEMNPKSWTQPLLFICEE